MDDKDNQGNGGRVTTQEFYKALLDVKEDISDMERRILSKLDMTISNAGAITSLQSKQKEMREWFAALEAEQAKSEGKGA